ncbi:GTPase family protein [Vibrio metschnikovii]|uniref:GTPase family protein n=1 Tax=unclassified Vibrio TaxID=2614977 RepID=UPI001482BF5C|nr:MULTISPECIES: GTPase family protein [unclassified Vibrio]EKO3578253.1 GTPase family protein [Vibrio metschnikovii]EKO3685736.1 GTPase family protein [Vibrio metschnikovii]EKO3689117.1 GTPase family protein [Vibrio metschnikovii]EKO3891247.1 GTPase family protein [Vibrio metschnikovii]NNN59726.1 GTPase family protein [Vibrio sp. A11]
MKSNELISSLEKNISSTTLDTTTKQLLFNNLALLRKTTLNILITGATGAGKSSTINALFNIPIAEVGINSEPHTECVQHYQLNNLVLWDTPGLGDGIEEDTRHIKAIKHLLNKKDAHDQLVIDLVLVILDGGSRDLGTPLTLINDIIIPHLGDEAEKRLIVGINQADVALKGPKAWNYIDNEPTDEALVFLEKQQTSVAKRIHKATQITIAPIYFVAGYSDGVNRQRPYNLSKLLYIIVELLPQNKRVILANRTISNDVNNWKDNDASDYNKKTSLSLWEAIVETTLQGASIGSDIGAIFGKPGKAIGKVIGSVSGLFFGGIRYIFGF